MTKQQCRRAVAVVPDLFFQARIREVASQTGVPLTIVKSEECLQEALDRGDVGLVIISLESADPDPMKIIEIASAAGGVRTVGYLNHVLEELEEKALESGCQQVMAKGAFSTGLAKVLREGPAG